MERYTRTFGKSGYLFTVTGLVQETSKYIDISAEKDGKKYACTINGDEYSFDIMLRDLEKDPVSSVHLYSRNFRDNTVTIKIYIARWGDVGLTNTYTLYQVIEEESPAVDSAQIGDAGENEKDKEIARLKKAIRALLE